MFIFHGAAVATKAKETARGGNFTSAFIRKMKKRDRTLGELSLKIRSMMTEALTRSGNQEIQISPSSNYLTAELQGWSFFPGSSCLPRQCDNILITLIHQQDCCFRSGSVVYGGNDRGVDDCEAIELGATHTDDEDPIESTTLLSYHPCSEEEYMETCGLDDTAIDDLEDAPNLLRLTSLRLIHQVEDETQPFGLMATKIDQLERRIDELERQADAADSSDTDGGTPEHTRLQAIKDAVEELTGVVGDTRNVRPRILKRPTQFMEVDAKPAVLRRQTQFDEVGVDDNVPPWNRTQGVDVFEEPGQNI